MIINSGLQENLGGVSSLYGLRERWWCYPQHMITKIWKNETTQCQPGLCSANLDRRKTWKHYFSWKLILQFLNILLLFVKHCILWTLLYHVLWPTKSRYWSLSPKSTPNRNFWTILYVNIETLGDECFHIVK